MASCLEIRSYLTPYIRKTDGRRFWRAAGKVATGCLGCGTYLPAKLHAAVCVCAVVAVIVDAISDFRVKEVCTCVRQNVAVIQYRFPQVVKRIANPYFALDSYDRHSPLDA